MTGKSSADEDPKPEEEQKGPDELLRGLSSESCRDDEEGTGDASSQKPGPQGIESESDRESQLVNQKLTCSDIVFVMQTLKKKAPYDEIPIKQLFYGMSSAFTKIPIPHNVNSKHAGDGKSYLLSLVAGYFPNRYVLPLTGMSDKAIFHRPGVMVIEKYNDEAGDLSVEPIDPIIDEIELEIEELKGQIQETGNNNKNLIKESKRRIKELDSKIKDMQGNSEKLIDLDNQIILGLDTPKIH